MKLGYPNALAQVMIAAAWSSFFVLVSQLGEESVTLASFMQTLTGFFAFIIQGLTRGIIAISSNLIGSRKDFLIIDTLLSGIKLSIIFSLFIFLMYISYPKGVLKLFFHSEDLEKVFGYFAILKTALLWGWLAFVCKSIRGLLSGVLISAGQTKFVMQNEVISIWLCFIIPIWFCIKFFTFNISWPYFIGFFYNLISAAVYSYKLAKIKWANESRVI